MTDDKKRSMERQQHYFEKLMELDAPDFLKAHFLISVIVPNMMKAVGVKDCANELARMMLRSLSLQCGVCTICNKAEMVIGDEVCAKCLAELDQVAAMIRGGDV